MKQGYITYYEGYDEKDVAIFNGNHAVNIEYDDFIDANELFNGCIEYLLAQAQLKNSQVTRIVIKGLFRL
ncbi:hypothetical protein AXX01_00062 [Acinetobacter phage LAPP1]|nr:hypothetical protein AXX01_00062 [Acinetobacter phage JC1]